MNLELLDCTLRDGGYINNWQFNQEDIIQIINSLIDSGIENIECGYLSNSISTDSTTRLNSLANFNKLLEKVNKKDSSFYLMVDFNDFDLESLTAKSKTYIDSIRLAFHKKNLDDIYSQAKIIKDKGYGLYIQPMAVHLYSDNELNQLVEITERLNANALYIVDSFGCLSYHYLKNYFYTFNEKLSKNINIGLHLHNNIHNAFSNAINLISKSFERKIIIDTSITGIGRGAGNINTEFMLLYLEQKLNNYNAKEVLKLIEELDIFKQKNIKTDIAYFLSGIYQTHPAKSMKLLDENKSIFEIYDSFLNN